MEAQYLPVVKSLTQADFFSLATIGQIMFGPYHLGIRLE
jgi:hypothetical protein